MKNNIRHITIASWSRLAILVLSSVLFTACNEDVDVYADGDPVPIVYSILDPAADVQYVRLGRSYIGSAVSGDIPPEVDSTVWNMPHEVYLEEYTDGVKGNTYRFEPDNDIQKDTGFFPASNLRLYFAKFRPVYGRTYHLYVYFPDMVKMVSATTRVHDMPQILEPLPISVRKINFEQGQPCVIRWYPGQNTGVYEMIFRVHYRDSSALSEDFASADYSSGGVFNLKTDQMQEYSMGGPSFFQAMAREIPVKPGVVRQVISVEFIMMSGNEDLAIHFRSGQEIGSNFTNLTEYSNIGNGVGIFASRSISRVPNLALSNVTLDELANGDITGALGFKDSKGN